MASSSAPTPGRPSSATRSSATNAQTARTGIMADLTLQEAGALAPLVSPAQALALVEAGAILIDVRSDAGRLSDGALPGAAVVAKDEVESRFDIGSPNAVTSSKS